MNELVAAILFAGVVAYAVFAGADFGSGFWDLTAGDAKKGAALRTLIDSSIGPVWEANHVWLIFVLVYLWTGFPDVFAAVMETMFVPFTLAGFGIVLRGSGFAFRKFAPTIRTARLFGVAFATSSVLTPFVFGAIAGGIASGRVPLDGRGDAWDSWTGSVSLVGGTLAVTTCAFLAAVFLTVEARRRGAPDLEAACRRRALGMGAICGLVALVGIAPLEHDATDVFDGLTGRALPLVLASGAGGLVALAATWRCQVRIARVAAVVAVAAVVGGWGVAQYPDMIAGQVTIDQAAAPRSAMAALLVASGIASATVVPSLAYLYWLTQRRRLA
jgi:cytochrome bd ubiquinol oxidase subunit II